MDWFPYERGLRLERVKYETLRGITQPAITCSKLTVQALEQGVNYSQS